MPQEVSGEVAHPQEKARLVSGAAVETQADP